MEQQVGCGFVLVQMNISFLDLQDSVYPSMNANFYKFGLSPPGSASYYDPAYVYEVHNHGLRNEEYRRPPLENSSTATNERTSRVNTEWEVNENRSSHDDPVECKF
jgi:E3 ubiquitin-protein ligase BIG BROTHER-like protein